MSGTITKEENELISQLKRDGVLKRFNPDKEMKNITKNGGVAVICSDGDIDAEPFHRRLSHRPHAIKIFGGPLLFAPDFGGYNAVFAHNVIGNIKQGMEVKKTRTLYLYFHAPCGMATAFKHEIPDILKFAQNVNEILKSDGFFSRVFTLFHAKRVNRAGNLEENTYLINL